MAKKATKKIPLVLDRVLLVALLSSATGYIIRGSWVAVFFEAAGIILGVIWAFRAITTNPSKELRLLASLVLVLLGTLLAFMLGTGQGLL